MKEPTKLMVILHLKEKVGEKRIFIFHPDANTWVYHKRFEWGKIYTITKSRKIKNFFKRFRKKHRKGWYYKELLKFLPHTKHILLKIKLFT